MISLRIVFDFKRVYLMGRYVGVTFSIYSFGYYSTTIDLIASSSCFTYCIYCSFVAYGSILIWEPIFMRDSKFSSLIFSLIVGDGYYSVNLTFFFLSLNEFLEDVLI